MTNKTIPGRTIPGRTIPKTYGFAKLLVEDVIVRVGAWMFSTQSMFKSTEIMDVLPTPIVIGGTYGGVGMDI